MTPRRLHPAWVVLTAVTVCMLAATGVRAVFGIYIKPMEAEMGWTRSGLSGAAAVSLLLLGAVGPWAGRIADRWGTRRLIIGSLIVPIATLLTTTHSWRVSTTWLGIGLFVLIVTVALFLVWNDPADRGVSPYGARGAAPTAAQAAATRGAGRVSVVEAARAPQF